MGIREEIAKLHHSAEIELFVLDGSEVGAGVHRFHAGTNDLGGPIVWQNEKYDRRRVALSGFTQEQGQRPAPTLTLSNVSGLDGHGEIDYDALEGARLVRIVTLARYLDPINFPKGENPNAGDEEIPAEEYIVKRVSGENVVRVEFELGTPDDALNRKIPARQITRQCWAVYKDIETGCDWRPNGVYYDLNNERVSDPEKDRCPHSIEGCETRFGAGNPLPFMGSPAVGLITE